MKKFISKNSYINLAVGLIFIAAFLVIFFTTDWLENLVGIFIGALVIIFSTLRYFKDYGNKRSDKAILILTGEYAVALVLSVLLIFEIAGVGVSLVLGLVFYLRGLAYLLIMQLLNKREAFHDFVLYLAILTLGAYILFSGLPLSTEELSYGLLAIGLAIGLFYAAAGVTQLKSTK